MVNWWEKIILNCDDDEENEDVRGWGVEEHCSEWNI